MSPSDSSLIPSTIRQIQFYEDEISYRFMAILCIMNTIIITIYSFTFVQVIYCNYACNLVARIKTTQNRLNNWINSISKLPKLHQERSKFPGRLNQPSPLEETKWPTTEAPLSSFSLDQLLFKKTGGLRHLTTTARHT